MYYPKVSIIILNWNGLKDTLECLESVKKSDYPNYEIILIDNASKNREGEIIKSRFPELILVQNEMNLGFAGGNNIGMRYALKNGAYYVWLLNNDTVIESNTLSDLVAVAEKTPNAGLLSPLIYYYANPEQIQFCGSSFDKEDLQIKYIKNLTQINMLDSRSICLWGTALFIKKTVIEGIGYLDEKFFAYHEDADYSLRALNYGFINIIVSSAKIFHKHHYLDDEGLKHLPPHCAFYRARNDFWLWQNYFNSSQRKFSRRKYIAKTIRRAGYFQERLGKEYANASLDGMCNALRNIGGSWDQRVRMPNFLKTLAMCHPYLFADLIDFNFKNIFKTIRQRKCSSF